MFRSVNVCSLLVFLAGILSGGVAFATSPQSISVYTWSEYMDPAVVEEFESTFDAQVDFAYFDSNALRDKKLTASGGTGFDVIAINEVQMTRYVKRGWLAPLSLTDAPNIDLINTRWKEAFGGASRGYGAAYFWGTMGIAWRSDLYPKGFSSWKDLIEPDPALSGRILMSGYGRELIGFALKADGHSINTSDRSLIREAGRKLALQKPHVRVYGYPSLTEESSLITGEAWATPMYSGDALVLRDINDRIEYRIPEEGGLLWVDYLAVASSSRNKSLATAFINFLNRPDIAARNAEYVSFATTNTAAIPLLPEDYLSDPVIYPSEQQLQKSEFMTTLPPRSTKSLNSIVSELLDN